ncbi:DUF3530 family protein [Solemya velum gill symbiont]|uniref:DUF3530 family protein n=1 Tax=Solemya velum gill symbiont TaxID=2340 RepID=UPI000996CA8B|nr:DUF3530 family protein [Solemya velum gill symbiont]OOZ59096.1 hypothetical protein BOW43_07010 [Solemya velum gill symbiont]
MQGSVKLRLLCGFFLLLPSITIMAASDLEREQRLEDEIVDAILDGDPLDLPRGDGGDFLGIYTETDADEPKGAVIILHGRGYHPDWAYTVQPLRVGLIDYGWNTLSIQLPVLKKEAKYFDYVRGAHMANFWLDDVGHENIDAYVGLGMGATDYQQPMVRDFPLDKLKIPVLDLYGEHDYPAVHRYAPLRKMMIEAGGNPKSSQQVLPEADHYFTYRGDELIEAVGNWLDTL